MNHRPFTATEFDPEIAQEMAKLTAYKKYYLIVVDDSLVFKAGPGATPVIKKMHFGQIANIGVISTQNIFYFVGHDDADVRPRGLPRQD